MAFPQRLAMGMTLLAVMAASSGAQAQQLVLNDNQDGVRRDDAHYAEPGLDNNEINWADCDRDEIIQFNIGVTGVVDDSLDFQIWRGTDCANGRTRFDDTSNCVQIFKEEARESASLNVPIPVRDIVSATEGAGTDGTGGTSGTGGTDAGSSGSAAGGAGGTAGTETAGGTAGTETAGGTAGTEATSGAGGTESAGTSGTTSSTGGTSGSGSDICAGDPNFQAPIEFALHFILVDGSGDQPTADYTPAIWNARYDLVGPNEPANVTAGVGENALILSWSIEDKRGDINKYYAYCDPPPSVVIGEDDLDDGCSDVLPSGERPPAENFCGESDGYSASMQTSPLQNNVLYTVGVAAVDNFNNLGKLSQTDCKAPQLVRDYYEAYRQAGGNGGGGLCAIGARRSNEFAALTLLGALALYVRRRKASARRHAN